MATSTADHQFNPALHVTAINHAKMVANSFKRNLGERQETLQRHLDGFIGVFEKVSHERFFGGIGLRLCKSERASMLDSKLDLEPEIFHNSLGATRLRVSTSMKPIFGTNWKMRNLQRESAPAYANVLCAASELQLLQMLFVLPPATLIREWSKLPPTLRS